LNEEMIYAEIGRTVMQFLCDNNIINKTGLRNFLIKQDYKRLRETLNASDSVSELCDKYHISEYAINSILFRK
jgi:hypothetical protein